ncbi:ABC-2 transporter permease [Bariatricus massiliensis]|uniref:ABC-2 transporter permease n=1 Tax=Bariatricus massiliensis TaxID=1745713 RepID=A0ABS8DFY7_9FIRM|nr:ABC-2 transporter permease [Bariatricus massiliensis]MCB7304217.1 ABC-2 transporter permease [Bariatricus massiliensis]MCB7374352.1 ABC-2 transporter permease [Bariatricus massiliensis]MCB7387327.1 ABC-2 transporter permease [Bariatricus massiliensis]MCB7411489.1 ABC-2 transporter permease [Bariatricus massiliensis]MCQ5252565.1 ABC-2 transporter permease [Bariatricus massiliensis]
MKGMLLKDIFLLKELKKMVFLFAAVSIMMLIGGGNEAIVLGYFNVLMLSVAMNSTSYDDYNNGYSFLFTLPITRKEYVKEKYIFGFLVGFSGWLFTVVITSVSLLARGKMNVGEWGPICLIFLGLSILGLSVSLPAAIKYGSDKGRIMMILFMAAIFVIIVLGEKLVTRMGIDLDELIYRLFDSQLIPLISVVIVILAAFISYSSSVKIIEKKEF